MLRGCTIFFRADGRQLCACNDVLTIADAKRCNYAVAGRDNRRNAGLGRDGTSDSFHTGIASQ